MIDTTRTWNRSQLTLRVNELLPESTENLDDWRWLTSDAGTRWLHELSSLPADALKWTSHARKKGVSAARCRLLVEQLTLRPLARNKFDRADEMFFRRQLLEQATDQRLAGYKAQRFAGSPQVVDMCCGLGGDLMSLASVSSVTGVDADRVACLLAEANLSDYRECVNIVVSRAEDFVLQPADWVHIDPDRRAGPKRTTTLDHFSPSTELLEKLVHQQNNVAIKLAPATRLPDGWQTGERQWLGDVRECKQQIAWFGDTVRHRAARTATAIDRDGNVVFEWVESTPGDSESTDRLDAFLFEPHPTVIAGRMIDSLANQFGLKRLAPDIQYLTGDSDGHPALRRFQILEACRMDRKAVYEELQRFQAGTLEIKKRGVDQDLMNRFGKMRLEGDQPLVLVLTRLASRHLAIICRRNEPRPALS